MTVGNRIKQCRLDLGMTQDELAAKMGYNGKSTVSAAENCGDNITTTKVRKFADALGVSFRYLMGYEDNQPEDTDRAKSIREFYKHNPLSDEEWEIIKMYRKVDDSTREAAYNVLRGGNADSNSSEVG